MNIVFISGSRSIKKLPYELTITLDRIAQRNEKVLVGDSKGVDQLIQKYLKGIQYYNVTVYSIYNEPRILESNKFKIKPVYVPKHITNKFKQQQVKDIEMTKDCHWMLCIWDGLSRGTRDNIIRGNELNKKVIVYNV